MNSTGYWVGLAGAISLIGIVLEMVRRRRLRGKYALTWLALGVISTVLATRPAILDSSARLVGVDVPTNLLFFMGFLALAVMIMQLSAATGLLEERVRILAEELAIARQELSRHASCEAPGRLHNGDVELKRDDSRKKALEPTPPTRKAAETYTARRPKLGDQDAQPSVSPQPLPLRGSALTRSDL